MLEKLAHSLGRSDEGPNIRLALDLVETGDREGIREIVNGLGSERRGSPATASRFSTRSGGGSRGSSPGTWIPS